MRKVIVNSTPLIALSSVNRLNILKKLYNEIWIPTAVFEEISVKQDSVCKHDVNLSLQWIHVERIQNQIAKEMFKTQLHDGEVEVMILAKEINADLVIIDDKNAKKHAKYLGLPVTGTLGVLMKAKQERHIDALAPILDELLRNHIYISQSLVKLCLKQVGE